MSDLSVTVSSTGFVGVEKSSTAGELVNKSVAAETEKKVTEVKPEAPKEKVVAAEVENALTEMNGFMQSMQRNLSFTVDEQLGRDIVSVKDIETDEVIRQIPSEELVVLLKKMDDVVGILFDTKV
ncbi:MAG: flagellar protein FlaG [Oleiphilaceae bacterium]|jgi:flagellar protein FlaG